MTNILKNKKIILGVTGSISAYKSPLLLRELIKAGAHVSCIMTTASTNFVTPLVLENLSRNDVIVEMFDKQVQRGGAWHIQLANWADAMIIAPCSAATLSKLANGLCDNSLITVAMALNKDIPLLIAPAMDSTMLLNSATQRNLKTLEKDGCIIIPPDEGELSSGLKGPGRLPEMSVLLDYLENALSGKRSETKTDADEDNSVPVEIIRDKNIDDIVNKPLETLEESAEKDKWNAEYALQELKLKMAGIDLSLAGLKNKKVIITAGPTLEPIDDVRYISNHSSGKMGYAIAEIAKSAGAEVVLISGPVSLEPPKGVRVISVQTAEEMYDVSTREFVDADFAVMSAAVADYTPESPQKGKIKKEFVGNNMHMQLVETKDILAELGHRKSANQVVVGFALESSNEVENGHKKMTKKNADMIVVNSAGKPDSGFGGDNNTITILTAGGTEKAFPPMSKAACSHAILHYAAQIAKGK